MKKIVLSLVAVLVVISLNAQNDVTKFMGIPVDGSRQEMVQKLVQKGFAVDPYDREYLVGEFNGMDVKVAIVTNRGKVWRIALRDNVMVDGPQIITRFNVLCGQFENNPNYITIEDYRIPYDEDIAYKMHVKDKRYSAFFLQKTEILEKLSSSEDDNAVYEVLYDALGEENIRLLQQYSEEQLPYPDMTEKVKEEIYQYFIRLLTSKQVWFTVSDYCGKYYIIMYYDNMLNCANGEEL